MILLRAPRNGMRNQMMMITKINGNILSTMLSPSLNLTTLKASVFNMQARRSSKAFDMLD